MKGYHKQRLAGPCRIRYLVSSVIAVVVVIRRFSFALEHLYAQPPQNGEEEDSPDEMFRFIKVME